MREASSDGKLRVGFAGLGRMGRPMAQNLIAAGFDVALWNRTKSVSDELAKDEAATTLSPKSLASGSDVVLTMLADDVAVEQVYLGLEGLFSGVETKTIFAEMGTISADLARQLDLAAQACGSVFVDAPVSGSTKAAADAQLLIMAGIEEARAGELVQVFEKLGKRTIWLGEAGQGASIKLAVNMLIHGLNQTLSEALVLAEAAGIDAKLAYSVFENSAAAAPMLHYRKEQYLNEMDQEVSFSIDLAAKDVRLALDIAAETGRSLPQTILNFGLLSEAIDQGYGGRDMASILSFLRGKQ